MKAPLIGSILFVALALGVYFIRSQRSKSSFEPLSLQEAQKIAEEYLSGNPHEMVVRPEMTQELEFGFVFYPVPRKFLETQNPSDEPLREKVVFD